MMADAYSPKKSDKFTFGLWTVGNPGRDPFGEPVRARPRARPTSCRSWRELRRLGRQPPRQRPRPVRRHRRRARPDRARVQGGAAPTTAWSCRWRRRTSSATRLQGRRLHRQRPEGPRVRAAEDDARRWTSASSWARRSTSSGAAARASRRTPAATRARRFKRYREALNFLCEYARDQKYDLKFALEAKPNEPRGDIYLPTTGHMLAFIETLDHPEMVGVNPEVAHEHDGGPELLPRRRAGASTPASSSTSTSTTRSPAATTRTCASAARA